MTHPKLDAPGKGLPFYERLAIKHVALPKFYKATSWDDRVALFVRQGDKLAALVKANEQRADERVLVSRVPGLEDSSRYWSLNMVLTHLISVGSDMGQLVVDLSRGRVPDRMVDIASYKPKAGTTVEAFTEFQAGFLKRMSDEVQDRESKARFPHPWFGPFTADMWLGMAALHQRLHRQQAEAIVRGFNSISM